MYRHFIQNSRRIGIYISTCGKYLKCKLSKSYTAEVKNFKFCFFYLVYKLSLTPYKKGKQHISKEWTKQPTQIPILIQRQAQS